MKDAYCLTARRLPSPYRVRTQFQSKAVLWDFSDMFPAMPYACLPQLPAVRGLPHRLRPVRAMSLAALWLPCLWRGTMAHRLVEGITHRAESSMERHSTQKTLDTSQVPVVLLLLLLLLF